MKANRLIGQIYRKHILPFELTNSQLSILFMISNGIHINQAKLAEMLAMEKSTVSRNLRRLLESELIIKSPQNNLTMTRKGKSLLKKVIPAWDQAMKEARSVLGHNGEKAVNLILNKLTK